MVGDSDRGEDALDDGGDRGICVPFDGGVGEVAAQAVGADDGAIMGRSANQSGGGEVESVGGGQANQEDGGLMERENWTLTFD